MADALTFDVDGGELEPGDTLYVLNKDARTYEQTTVASADKIGYSVKIEVEDSSRTYSVSDFDVAAGDLAHLARPDDIEAVLEAMADVTGTEFTAEDDDPEIVTDGGETDIRDRREVEHADDAVRTYSADGSLYAYREGDEHVVVSRGNEPATRWTKRVPAERTAVVPDQHLWTIPDNWDERVRINGAGQRRFAIYHIPEPGVDVLVSVPNKNHLVDAWYGVKRVGELVVTYDDSWDWDELEKVVDHVREMGTVDDAVVDGLEQLQQRERTVERLFRDDVNMYAEEALFEEFRHGVPSLDGWTIDPWGDTYPIKPVLEEALQVTDEALDEVEYIVRENTIAPHYPEVRVDVAAGEGLPSEFSLRGLIQAGCSPPEAVDYLMTEIGGLSQTEWGEERGKSQPSISKNVTKAVRNVEA